MNERRPLPGALGIVAALAAGSVVLAAPSALAQPDATYRNLSGKQELAVVDNKGYIPAGLGITDTYVQDFPAPGLEILLCYDENFKPLMLPKVPGAWMAMQGTGGVGYGVYIHEYDTAKAAQAAGRTMLATTCAAQGKDPKAGLAQSQRTLPRRNGSPGLAITTSYFDDGELETNESAYRQVGLAILHVGATYNGGPDSPLGKRVRATLPKMLDQLTANYVKAAKS